MMPAKGRLAATLITLTLFGCSSGQPKGALGREILASGGTRTEYIRDPSLNNMNAYEIPVPAKWHFQGALIQGGNCVPVPFGVFRATSPDGLNFVEQMPTLGWAFGKGPGPNANNSDCLPLKQAMGAQDFLKYLSEIMKVEYVGDEPVPADVEAKAQKDLSNAEAIYAPKYAAIHVQPPKTTLQLARAIVRYKNGTFVMKGRLATMVRCMEMEHAARKFNLRGMADWPAWTSDQCTASIQYLSAAETQYQVVMKQWDSKVMEGRELPEWSQAWVARNTQQTQNAIQQMNEQAAAQRQASAQQFAHDQAVRQQMHEQFLATMQRGTDMSMQRAAQIANSNHTMASDWVDYALDQRTVLDPNTGQLSKVSSSYSYTWVDSSGRTSYQTNDVNADPNGTLQGTWTRQQVVHGDGTQ
jgi:hypothetical protein